MIFDIKAKLDHIETKNIYEAILIILFAVIVGMIDWLAPFILCGYMAHTIYLNIILNPYDISTISFIGIFAIPFYLFSHVITTYQKITRKE